MKLVIKKEKWQSPIFEKVPSGQEGPKIRLRGFGQKYNPFICTFFTWIWKYYWYLTFCNNHMSGKNMVLRLWSWNHFTNQNVGFFKLQYVKNVLRWLEIQSNRSNKFIQSFPVGVVRHVWACPKLCQIVSQLHLKNELRYKVRFLHV